MAWLRQNPVAVAIGGLVGLASIAFLAFGVFGVQTLFTDDEVNEANPFVVSAGVSGRDSDATTADLAAQMNAEMDGVAAEVAADDAMPAMPDVATLREGSFEGRAHPASGTALLITDGSQTFLRLEDDFATDNGPDLNVYLSKAPIDADSGVFDDDFIDLGDLKGNIGSQNYEIDADLDLGEYQTVVIWCVRFGVAFGAAPLDQP